MAILGPNEGGEGWRTVAMSFLGAGGLLMTGRDNVGGNREQVLSSARDPDGPYRTRIRETLVAGNQDWRGFDDDDILNGPGPYARHFGGGLGDTLWRRGSEYAKKPDGAGNICGFAIQRQGTAAKLVIATTEILATGGPNGIGSGLWRFFARDAGRNLTTTIGFSPGEWREIGTVTAPTKINGERWGRQPTFHFNQSGDECANFIPINELGDALPFRTRFSDPPPPAGFTKPGAFNNMFADNRLSLLTISVDAFAETVSSVDSGEEPPINVMRSTTLNDCTFNDNSPSPNSSSYSDTTTTTISGSRRIAVDYKGDTQVFATLAGSGTRTQTRSSSWVAATSQNLNFSSSGALRIALNVGPQAWDWFHEDESRSGSTTDGSGSFTVTASVGVGSSGSLGVPNFTLRTYYLDLRNDMLAAHQGTIESFQNRSTTANSVTVSACSARINSISGINTITSKVNQVHIFDGVIVNQYDPQNDVGSEISPGFIPEAIVPRVTTAGCCTGSPISAPSDADIDRHLSLESVSQFPDSTNPVDFLGAGYATDIFGNGVMSSFTLEGLVSGSWTLPAPGVLNFLSGDDLIDVLNQVDYTLGPISTAPADNGSLTTLGARAI